MSEIRLGLQQGQTHFASGDLIEGAADWQLPTAPKSAEIRLCWFTRGRGEQDAAIVESVTLEDPQATDLRTFSFRAPHAPVSFRGQLVSLAWAVELVLEPKARCERVEIVIAPGRQERTLRKVEGPAARKWYSFTAGH